MEVRGRIHNYLIFLLYFTVIFLLMSRSNFQTAHDDVWFPTLYANANSLFEWLGTRYQTWSGRIAVEAVLPHVLGADVWVWRMLNVVFFLMMAGAIYVLGTGPRTPAGTARFWLVGAGILLLVLTVKRKVLEGGVFWATGSMNYLWPAACLTVALVPYSRLLEGKNLHFSLWLLVVPPAVYASYQEQSGLILACFSIAALAVHRLRFKSWSVSGMMLAGVIIANFLVLVLAPGNVNRLEQEIVRFYPAFHSLPNIYKIQQGINYTLLNHWFFDSVRALIILCGLTWFLAHRMTESRILHFCSKLIFGYVLLSLLFGRGLGDEFAYLLNYDIYDYMTAQNGVVEHELHVLPMVIGVVTLLLMPFVWFRLFSFSATFIKLILFYFAGLLSSLAVSMSPTIFASGHRIFFIPDMMIVVVILILFVESLQYLNVKSRFFISCYAVLAAAAFVEFIKLLR